MIRANLMIFFMYFNSRPCERGDIDRCVINAGQLISIPAPARGATLYSRRKVDHIYFNSRPCERGDRRWMLCQL